MALVTRQELQGQFVSREALIGGGRSVSREELTDAVPMPTMPGISALTGKPVSAGPVVRPAAPTPSGVYTLPSPEPPALRALPSPEPSVLRAPPALGERLSRIAQEPGIPSVGEGILRLLDMSSEALGTAAEKLFGRKPILGQETTSIAGQFLTPRNIAEQLPYFIPAEGVAGLVQRGAARAAIKSPVVRGALKDLQDAAVRGESGLVTPTVIEHMQKVGVPDRQIKELVDPFLQSRPVLGDLGKAKIAVDKKVDEAITDTLNRISVGESRVTGKVTASDLYRDWVDELNPLKKLLDSTRGPSIAQLQRDWKTALARGEEGLVSPTYTTALKQARDLEVLDNPYELFRLLPGSWGKVDSFLSYRRFNINTFAFEGKSLQDILKPVRGDISKFRAYYTARQVVDLAKAGFQTGFDIPKARQVVKSLGPNFKTIANELTQYNNTLLKTLLDSGIISKGEYQKMVIFHKHYAPMFRVVPDQEIVFSRTAEAAMKKRLRGLEGSKPLERLLGSQARIIDPLESVIRNTYIYIRAADRNLAMRSMLDYAKKNPQFGALFKKVSGVADETPLAVPDALMAQELQTLGIAPSTLRALSPAGYLPRSNTVAVWENGIRSMYGVHPDIARVVKAMDKPEIELWTRLFAAPARWLRAGATLSPEFIMRNPVRDQLSAAIFSKYGFVPGIDFGRGIMAAFNRTGDYWKWKIAGGEHSMLVSLDRVALQRDLNRVISKYAEGGLITETLKGLNIMNPVATLQIMSMLGEKGTRLGEFMKAAKKLGSTKQALQKAAFASREVSLDFARAGARGRALNMIIAFWNAQVQGLDKIARAFHDAPVATSAKLAAWITVPSVILAAANNQDGRWQDIESWQKDLFWIVLGGYVSPDAWKRMTPTQKAEFNKEHSVYRIPKPFELGVIFGSAPERAVDWLHSHDPKATRDFIADLAQAASPGMLPTAALPLVEISANRSFLTGGRLIPRGQEDILPAEQRRAVTSNVAVHMSRILGEIAGQERTMSPVYIDQLITGWTGGLGRYATMLADGVLVDAGLDPSIPEPEDPSFIAKIPGLKAFVVRFPTAGAMDKLFKEERSQELLWNTATKLFKEGDPKSLEYLKQVEAKLVLLRQGKDAVTQALQFIEKVRRNPHIDPETKRRLMDTAMFTAINISRGVVEMGGKFTSRESLGEK